MAYSIIGIKSHQAMAKIAEVGAHNERMRETRNADPARRQENERLLGSGDLYADVQARLDAVGITKIRSNGVRAIEHMLTASPEWFHEASPERVREWVDRSMTFLRDRYGDNLVSAHLHMDETSPNIHAVMVPITPDGRLSKTYYFDKRAQLRELHTDYNKSVAPIGLERGTERSKATHQEIQAYYHKMGLPTREAWAMARQITIAPLREGETLEERLAATLAPALAEEQTRTQYWKSQATQTQQQLEGARERMREASTPSYDQYRDIAQRVRDTDLTDVLGALGGKRDQYDRSKWHVEGYELSIRGQKYADMHVTKGTPYARSGGAIDLVRYVKGYDFKRAVDYLNDRHYSGHAVETPAAEPTPYVQSEGKGAFTLPQEHAERWPDIRAYLVDQRGIPGSLVDEAHARGDVYATLHQGYPNAVFVRRDDEGQAIGAYMRGTRGRFYGMAKDSDKEAGYFSVAYGTPNRLDKPSLVIVESPIDALSYAALKSTGHAYGRIISTDGYGPLPTEAIDETLQAGGTVRGAFDNDGPAGGGSTLWHDMTDAYPQETSGDYTSIMRETPKAKDWNEDLQRTTEQAQNMSGFEMGR